MNAIERAIRAVSAVVMALAAVALILMMLMVTLDVAGKYLFVAPVPVTLEMVSNYYMVAVVFLPLAAVELTGGHIHVELIHARLPRVGRRILDIAAHALACLFFTMLTAYGWEVAVKKFEVGEFLMGQYSLIIWPSRFLVPLGCGLIAVLLALKTVRAAVHLARPDLDHEEPSAHGAME
ncbi:TRAP transporter small permease subunit [Albimonas pacifica]|uniref:TRAP transporter small permease protein n=1 Tax=Albimonas pacifica TaxID=1114924 RepID=A0A1I3ML45_9RHOB|nr:TRAP transporter small permease [Albimonas pacifica]SFI97651.1 TRAP-type mannitol/chloroaromatic compound transport system, small permease component [Albimonas pacifica]